MDSLSLDSGASPSKIGSKKAVKLSTALIIKH